MKYQYTILASIILLIAAVGAVPAVAADNTTISDDSPTQTTTDGDAFPITVTDATGTEVTLTERPERVTTTNPSAAQTMWELGAEDQVVGLTQYAYYLDGAESRQNVSAGFGVSVERVVGTEPDLVLAPNASAGQVEDLRAQGLTVYHLPSATDFDDVTENTLTIGQLTGNEQAARNTNEWVSANTNAVSTATADAERPQLLYPLTGGFAVGDKTFINTIIVASGAENTAAAEFNGYKQLNDEVVLTLDPSVLLITNQTAGQIIGTEPYVSTTAGKNNQSVRLNVNYLNQPAPRSVVYSTRNLTTALHPERYSASDHISRQDILERPENITATGSETAVANGRDELTFRLTVTDAEGDPVSGADIVATDTGTDIEYADGTTYQTDANGTVSITVSSSVVQDNVTFSFTEQTTNITTVVSGEFEAGKPEQISATVDSDETVADGRDTAEFTVVVDDASNNPVTGATVTVATIEPNNGVDGVAVGDSTVTADNGVATFTATATEADSVTLQFNQTDAGSSNATATFVEPTDDTSDTTGGGGSSASSTSTDTTTEPTPTATASPLVDDASPDLPGTTVQVESTDIQSITFSEEAVGGVVLVEQFVDVPADSPEVDDNRSVIAVFGVEVPRQQADQPANITFRLSADQLTALNRTDDDIAVMYASETATEYETLETNTTVAGDIVRITAETPGFSTFVLTTATTTEETSTNNSSIATPTDEPSAANGTEQPAVDSDGEATTNETESPTANATEMPDQSSSETDDDTPGFTAVVAVIALIIGSLFAIRQNNAS